MSTKLMAGLVMLVFAASIPVVASINAPGAQTNPCVCCGSQCTCVDCQCDENSCDCDAGGQCYCGPACTARCCDQDG